MTELRDFHASVFDFATKVMTAVESRRGGSDRSSQLVATMAFGGNDISRVITISHAPFQSNEHSVCRFGAERQPRLRRAISNSPKVVGQELDPILQMQPLHWGVI